MPPGFGTGHSLPTLAIVFASSSIWRNVETSSSVACGRPRETPSVKSCSGASTAFLFFRLGLCTCRPSTSVMDMSESARVRRGAGHGKIWGTPTMINEASRVAAKRELVDRDRGCR